MDHPSAYCGRTYGTMQIVDIYGIALFVLFTHYYAQHLNLSTLTFATLLTERPNQTNAMSGYLRQRFECIV
jgi:hypothetical protein